MTKHFINIGYEFRRDGATLRLLPIVHYRDDGEFTWRCLSFPTPSAAIEFARTCIGPERDTEIDYFLTAA
jgi:hypothetical protein